MLDILSAARAHGGRPENWADDVRELVLSRAAGVVALETERYEAAGRSLTFLGSGGGSRSREITLTGHGILTAEDCRAIYESATFVRSTRCYYGGAPPAEVLEGMAGEGIGDILGVTQPRAGRRSALCFTVFLGADMRGDARQCDRWGTLVRHLGALSEAREWLDRGAAGLEGELDAPARGEARLDEAACSAVRELDRRRARAVRRPGEEEALEVLDIWSFLLDRGFAVLDYDREGGRLVAVRLRDPEWDALHRLAPEERDVVEMAARGLSNKEVAFALRTNEATVATRLRRAQRRLGVKSRVELIELAGATGYRS